LFRFYRSLRDPGYNFIIRSAPLRDSDREYLHWYVSIIPRVTETAGFEMGTGMFINTALPEESAAFLRSSGQTAGAPAGKFPEDQRR
jgi:UDPglucose--hexose-1-phosphate uridylyltransferase